MLYADPKKIKSLQERHTTSKSEYDKQTIDQTIALLQSEGCCWVNRMPCTNTNEVCLLTALDKMRSEKESLYRVACRLNAELPDASNANWLSLTVWNDAPGRTKADVIDLLQRARAKIA
jgi:hypothetical protein